MGSGVVTPVRVAERLYFLAVALLALWVGIWGFFDPRNVGRALPFVVPPLHARFLGAMYLSGLTLMVGAALAGTWAEVRVVPSITAVWTGGLLVVSLIHFDEFDLGEPQDQVWFAAYVAYPLIALWLSWRHRGDTHERLAGEPLPGWATTYLAVQGAAAAALGVALMVVPGSVAKTWPWPITSLLAQLYSAPLLAYGVGSLLLSRQRTWPEVRVCAVAMFVFAAGVLVASLIHRDLFSSRDAAAWLWFGAFGGATVALAVLGASAVTRSAPAARA
jgi:hypothetical protein